MKAQVITIGDEILIGQIVDTNSAWLSSKLNDAGVVVDTKLSIGDREDVIIKSVEAALGEVDIVIITGGLGPTKDDITKETLAKIFSSDMVRDEDTYLFLKELLTNRGVAFNELNQSQAVVPKVCRVLPNRNGTAPGMWFERDGKILVSLPGVPFEMKLIMEEQVIPMLKERFTLSSIVHKTIMTFGLAESVLATHISEWESRLPKYISLAYLPNPAGIRLRLSAYNVEEVEAKAVIDGAFKELEGIIPYYFIGYGDITVAEVVANILIKKGATLSVAESCSGGALSGSFTKMAGSSKYFVGGVVSYSNDIKHRVLGVSVESLDQYGAVSKEVAMEMSNGVRALCCSDYAISTTGIAGPDGGTDDKPVGTVWISVSWRSGTVTQKMVFGALREPNIIRSSSAAINLLRLILIDAKDVYTTQGVL